MKKTLSVIGGVFLVLILVIASVMTYMAYEGRRLDASSKAYVDNNVPQIVSTWSKEELLKRASPQLIKILDEKPERTDQLFQMFSKLGALRSYEGSTGNSNISYTATEGKVITANYVATAKFEDGDAQIAVRLIQSSGRWQVLVFNVNSPAFIH